MKKFFSLIICYCVFWMSLAGLIFFGGTVGALCLAVGLAGSGVSAVEGAYDWMLENILGPVLEVFGTPADWALGKIKENGMGGWLLCSKEAEDDDDDED